MVLRGEIECPGDLAIQGTVEGPIEAQGRVWISRRGAVRGEVRARSAEVAGELEGSLSALERIEIKPDGRVTADLRAPRILIADGARFEGRVFMDRVEDDESAAEER
jgi:cytoskeletal protein CcmA (bactofilin family)